MTEDAEYSGPLDVATLEVIGGRADTHPLVDGWTFEPDSVSPRQLTVHLKSAQYPAPVESARLDIRWYDGGDYTFHYLESQNETVWQCRWDTHPKPGEQSAHFHPPPDADRTVDSSELETSHHLGVLFFVLDWVEKRVERLHGR